MNNFNWIDRFMLAFVFGSSIGEMIVHYLKALA